jgi:hypothetical protein
LGPALCSTPEVLYRQFGHDGQPAFRKPPFEKTFGSPLHRGRLNLSESRIACGLGGFYPLETVKDGFRPGVD